MTDPAPPVSPLPEDRPAAELDWVAELRARLMKAATTLNDEALSNEHADRKKHLASKRQGVLLALDYLRAVPAAAPLSPPTDPAADLGHLVDNGLFVGVWLTEDEGYRAAQMNTPDEDNPDADGATVGLMTYGDDLAEALAELRTEQDRKWAKHAARRSAPAASPVDRTEAASDPTFDVAIEELRQGDVLAGHEVVERITAKTWAVTSRGVDGVLRTRAWL